MGVDFFAAVVLGSVGGIVKEGDDFFVFALLDETCVMLETKLDVGTELEVRSDTSESPNNLTGCAVDLVHRTRIARGDQVVTRCILVHGVDVEVVPRVG